MVFEEARGYFGQKNEPNIYVENKHPFGIPKDIVDEIILKDDEGREDPTMVALDKMRELTEEFWSQLGADYKSGIVNEEMVKFYWGVNDLEGLSWPVFNYYWQHGVRGLWKRPEMSEWVERGMVVANEDGSHAIPLGMPVEVESQQDTEQVLRIDVQGDVSTIIVVEEDKKAELKRVLRQGWESQDLVRGGVVENVEEGRETIDAYVWEADRRDKGEEIDVEFADYEVVVVPEFLELLFSMDDAAAGNWEWLWNTVNENRGEMGISLVVMVTPIELTELDWGDVGERMLSNSRVLITEIDDGKRRKAIEEMVGMDLSELSGSQIVDTGTGGVYWMVK